MTGEEIVRELFSGLDWDRGRQAARDTERTLMMPGDIGAVAILLTKLLGYAVDPDGYAAWSRERQLARLMEGIDAAIWAHDESATDVLFGEYRELLGKTGP